MLVYEMIYVLLPKFISLSCRWFNYVADDLLYMCTK